MPINVEVEFPVVTRTTPSRGQPKFVVGTAQLPAVFRELDDLTVPVACRMVYRYCSDVFRVDAEGQFYWRVMSPRPEEGEAFEGSLSGSYNRRPGTLRFDEVKHYFDRSERDAFKVICNKRDFDKPRRMLDRRARSYNAEIVKQQIQAKVEQLLDYLVMPDGLYLKSAEPLIRVTEHGHLYFYHGNEWSARAPNECFSFHELEKARELAGRLGGDRDNVPQIELLMPDRFSPSYLDRRVALVNCYILDLFKEYLTASTPEEIGQLLTVYKGERDLVDAINEAFGQISTGTVSPSVLNTAERILDIGQSSVFRSVIDASKRGRTIIDFLREEWDERPVNFDFVR